MLAWNIQRRKHRRELFTGKGFAQEGDALVSRKMVSQHFSIAACDDERQERIYRPQFGDEHVAFAIGKADIDDRDLNISIDQLEFIHSLGGRSRDLDLEAEILQLGGCSHLDERFILDEEHATAAEMRIKNVPELRRQGSISIWFGDEMHPRVQPAMMHDGVAGVAGGE